MLAHILLFAPLIWETVNDWYGDLNKSQDVYIRIAIALTCAAYAGSVEHFILALSIHFLLFDYIIGYRLIGRVIEWPEAHWFTWLGKKGTWDQLKFWRTIGPFGRLIIKLIVAAVAVVLYVSCVLSRYLQGSILSTL